MKLDKAKLHRRYRAFGLAIESEIDLFQLQVETDRERPADLSIVRGKVPIKGISESQDAPFLQATEGKLWLNIADVARFLIEDGNQITVDAANDVDPQTVNLYLLGSGLGAVLHQRNHLVLHGNAIAVEDGVIIVVAHSGEGKSTLAAEFFRRGFDLLADDVCAIDASTDVQPSYPYLKLWQDSIEQLKLDTADTIRIRDQKDKFYFPLGKQFCTDALPLHAIYILTSDAELASVKISKLRGIEKIKLLFEHSYRQSFANRLGLHKQQTEALINLLQTVKVTTVTRPQEKIDQVTDLAATIIGDYAAS